MRNLLLAAALLVAACGSTAESPPDIEYGRDMCEDCGMIIEEPRFASAYRLPDGEERLFDEVADMVLYAHGAGELDAVVAWVHDYETEEWIAAADALYVSGPIPTPMGGGIVAVATRDGAEALAAEVGGEVLTWTDLEHLVENGGLRQEHIPTNPEEGHS